MGRRKISVAELQLGMYVDELDRPWLETPFLFQGFPVLTQQELAQLRQYCRYVYIDEGMTASIRAGSSSRLRTEQQPQRFATRGINMLSDVPRGTRENRRPFLEALPEAREVYAKTNQYLRELFEEIRDPRRIDLGLARELTNRMVESIVVNENAMIWLSLLKRKDEYTSHHSINVSTLAIVFGSYLGLNEEALQILGVGGLLHDIGKMRVPLEVLNKQGHLSEEELLVMRQHPEFGAAILDEAQGELSPLVRAIVYSHHERYDGSGYPRGIVGEEIGMLPMIVSVVDVYDAMTSDRVYRDRLSAHEVLNTMYGSSSGEFKRELLEAFIRCLGIYPVGSIVELNSGEVGLVMAVNHKYHLRPLVLLLLDRDKRPYDQAKLMNLEVHQQSGLNIQIARILPSDAYGIDVRQTVVDFQPEAMEAASR